jgi:hypothetical protein
MSTRYLSICAVFKWEWPWLQEWVIYHQLVGVEHFYLYCNEDGQDMARSQQILAPFIRQGTVTFTQLPGKTFQLAAYNHAIRASRGQTRWLAAIDLDEFLFPVATETVSEVLKDFEDCPAVAFNWQCFGSSGLLKRPQSQLRDLSAVPPTSGREILTIKASSTPRRPIGSTLRTTPAWRPSMKTTGLWRASAKGSPAGDCS